MRKSAAEPGLVSGCQRYSIGKGKADEMGQWIKRGQFVEKIA
jgi:hypothetical protein